MTPTKIPPRPLTRIELDIVMAGSNCNEPGCKCGGKDASKEISIIKSAGVRVTYSDGVLNVFCLECRLGVNRIAVA